MMSDMDRPSTPAILVPVAPDLALAWLDRALQARRFLRTDTMLPSGYPAHQDEWLGFVLAPLSSGATVVLPAAIDSVFRVCLWLTAADPEREVVGWRRYRGLEPTMKLFSGGEPRFKDGEDDDHEVTWHVRPFDADRDAERLRAARLPPRADAMEAYAGPSLRTYADALRAPVPGDVHACWLSTRSALAR